MTKSRDLGNLAQTVAVNLPTALGTAGQTLVVNSGADGLEFGAASGGGSMTVYNDLNGTDGTPSGYTYLTNASSPSNGDLAFVTANNTVYVRAASGWRKIATVQEAPSAVTGHASSYSDIGQNATTDITLSTTDPEGFDVTWSYVVGGNGTLSGSNINNSNGDTLASIAVQTANSNSGGTNTITYRITRQTTTIAGDFTITFTATDSQSTGTSDTGAISFELAFVIDDSHYTSLLMATDGSAGANSTITYDTGSTSDNNFTVNGDPHAGTFSPYRHGGYSTYFDGSGDYIGVGSAIVPTAYDTDYTIEMWIYPTTTGSREDIFNQYAATASGRMAININTDATISFFQNGLSPAETKSSAISANNWYHLAVVNSSGTRSFYVNGSLIGTATGTVSMYSGNTEIGRLGDVGSNYFTGYITDVRVVNGTPITPASGGPTERLTTVSGTGYSTSLLTCHLPYIADGSSNAHSITVNGSTSTKPFGPYDYSEYAESDNGGSVYFDGTGNYVSVSDLGLSGDLTIEGWFYQSVAQSATYRCVIGASTYTATNSPLRIYTYGSIYSIWLSNTGGPHISGSFTANTWHHVALVRSSGTWTLYIDGISAGTSTTNGTYNFASTADWTLGADAATTYPFTGYLSDVRVVEGTAVYSGNFTPPTGPLTTTGGTYPSTTNVNTSITASNTKLLLKGTDAHVLDKSQTYNLKLVGNAAASTTQAKFSNTASVYFDGDADEIAYTVPTLSGNFTFEAFIYPESQIQSFPICFAPVWDATAGNRIVLSYDTSTDVDKFSCRVGSNFIVPSSTSSTGQWYHLAVVRSGSTVSMYIDGIRIGTQTYSGSISSRTGYIGGNISNSTGGAFKGYIQDFRVTNGLARYTAADERSNIPSAPLKG